MTILLSSTVRQGNDSVCSEMDGETVMMSIEMGNYYSLNPMGGRIWQLAEKSIAVSALCEKLLSEFAVEPSRCETEVLAFLNVLEADNLLSVQE